MIKAAKYCCIILYVVIFQFGCSERINVVGCYASNFAEGGFFIEHVHLNIDSTFNYRFAGDLINELHYGSYLVKKDTVILNFEKDSVHNSLIDTLSYKIIKKKPEKLLYHNHKLFNIDSTNRVIKYSAVFKAYKKYNVLRPSGYYHNKRHYLKQHPCEIWTN